MKEINLENGKKVKRYNMDERINGYVVGKGGMKKFDEEVKKIGLDEINEKIVRDIVEENEGRKIV